MFKKKFVKKPFFNPTQPINTSSDSPTDIANKKIKKATKSNNSLINFTEGRLDTLENFKSIDYSMGIDNIGFGRTLNVPKTLPAGVIPGPSYNGAISIGEKCKGDHCSIPVNPYKRYVTNMNSQYPSTYRLGNSSDIIPGIVKYKNTGLNNGPFNIDVYENRVETQYIINPNTNRKVKIVNTNNK